ncbi:MAG: hypothetical protein KGM87_10570 [Betaproteobacteria bacterium]|nr:hypothetical protein [Betaproteobacteria bacterium]
MIDSIRLLALGVCSAALAWGLWNWLGQRMFGVLGSAVIVYLVLENRRLRNSLRAREATPTSGGGSEP